MAVVFEGEGDFGDELGDEFVVGGGNSELLVGTRIALLVCSLLGPPKADRTELVLLPA